MKIISLQLKNFLIIPELEIELSKNFNAVTGETGSGKSLFVSAIKLLRGERATKNLVGKWGDRGELSSMIEVEPEDKKLLKTLDYLSIEPDEEKRIYLRRIIGSKNVCYVNGAIVSLTTFEKLLSDYIEISSQFENRELFKPEYQFNVIDQFIEKRELLTKYRELYSSLTSLEKEAEKLKERDDPSMRDYLEFQINEIEDMKIVPGEEIELEERVNFLENRQKIIKLVMELDEHLGSVDSLLSHAAENAEDLNGLINFSSEAERVSSVLIECSDILQSVQRIKSEAEEYVIDESVRDRFDRINTLIMKHSSSGTGDLVHKHSLMIGELEQLELVPAKIKETLAKLEKVKKEAFEVAAKLHSMRSLASMDIEKKIEKYLLKFGMKGITFKIVIEAKETLNEFGSSSIQFVVNTIGGDKLYSIKNLSGGELSRLLLSLKLIDNEAGRFILFDEIDSNIGGEIASKAADELKKTSKQNQILVVTHFPQTAAKADSHLIVEKETDDDVRSTLRILSNSERIHELARMMGNAKAMENIKAAEKLLSF